MNGKSTIRAEFLQRRRLLGAEDARAKSATITAKLVELPGVRGAVTLMSYVASKDNEVDTQALIRGALAAEKVVLVPRSGPGGTLAWCSLGAWEELARGKFGILEPNDDTLRVPAPPPDAPVIVPGIAFSPGGDRIGYGKGFFDRFLATHPGLKIGLAYDLQITPLIRPDAHDAPVDIVVTESTIYDCRG